MALNKKIILIMSFFVYSCALSTGKDDSRLSEIWDLFLSYGDEVQIKSFKRENLEKIGYPLIEIRTNGLVKQVLMLPISSRLGYINYISGSGQSLTLSGAAITKTNGMDASLISHKIKETSPIVFKTPPKKWPHSDYRSYGFITPMNQEVKINVECNFEVFEKEDVEIVEMHYSLTKIIENCKGKNLNFTNSYWVDDDGFVWKSRQWISQKNIYADLRIIIPFK